MPASRGTPHLAWQLVRTGLPAGPDTAPDDSAGFVLPLRTLAVTLALDAGDRDAARQWLVALDRWLDMERQRPRTGRRTSLLGGLRAGDGRTAQARTRARQALDAASAPRQPLVLLAAHRLLGELDRTDGRLADAEAHLAAALRLADACGARHERALVLLALAELRHARGDDAAARAISTPSVPCAAPMGAALTLAQADALDSRLPATSVTSPMTLPAGPDRARG